MKKTVLLLLCVVLLCSLWGCKQTPESPAVDPPGESEESSIGKMLCGVMALRCELQNANNDTVAVSDGTAVVFGVVENAAYLVTNFHVVYNSFSADADRPICGVIKAAPYGAESSEGVAAECIWFSKEYDLAVLYVENVTESFPGITVPNIDASVTPLVAEEIFVIGNTEGAGIALHRGNISRALEKVTIPVEYSFFDISLHLIRYDAAVNKGDSGGAVFSANGSLLGIANARRKDNAGGYAIPTSTVLPIVSQVIAAHSAKAEDVSARALRFGVSIDEVAIKTEYDEATRLPKTFYELRVTELEIGSVGAIFLAKGDVLLGVNRNGSELPLARSLQLTDLLNQCAAGDTLIWRYRRGESELTYEITVSSLQLQDIK